jgi:adenosine deaminase
MNNEQRAKSGKKLFSESEYFDFEKFRERFNSNPDYQKYDAKYYYESALLWSKSNNEKKADWIATVYNWCRKDVSLNKPHLYKPETLKLK